MLLITHHSLLITFFSSSTERQQVIKRQLRVVNRLSEFAVANSVTRHVQRLTHGVEVETNYVGRDTNGRNASLARKPAHRRLADLQHFRKLASSKKLLTLFHDENSKS